VLILHQPQTALKKLILGPWDLHHQCTLGLEDPQSDVTVLLDGPGLRRDVTHNHSMACGAPFTICIGFSQEEYVTAIGIAGLALQFHENSSGKQQLLGEIALRFDSSLKIGSQTLCFFQAAAYQNYCLPRR